MGNSRKEFSCSAHSRGGFVEGAEVGWGWRSGLAQNGQNGRTVEVGGEVEHHSNCMQLAAQFQPQQQPSAFDRDPRTAQVQGSHWAGATHFACGPCTTPEPQRSLVNPAATGSTRRSMRDLAECYGVIQSDPGK